MADQTHGYSGKSLAAKLGVKPGLRLLALGAPAHYAALVGEDGAAAGTDAFPAEIVHLFVPDRAALEGRIADALGKVAPDGMLWISWPKKASPLFRDLTEQGIRDIVLPSGWVDVKVCAVDADWSGLKFLKRRA